MSDERWPSLERGGAVFLALGFYSVARRVPMLRPGSAVAASLAPPRTLGRCSE
jgi:hypothetical protein